MRSMLSFPVGRILRMILGASWAVLLGVAGGASVTAAAQPGQVSSDSIQATRSQSTTALVIHGGAGGITRARMTAAQRDAYRTGLRTALEAGYDVLQNGGAALKAVEAAIVEMEANPLFNAGRGAVRTAQHTIELDAALMEGTTRGAGAVTGVSSVKHPIRGARAVMDASRHVMLAGAGAEAFAAEQGLERVGQSYFRIERSGASSGEAARGTKGGGTVGAVALAADGTLAAGTSTGGLSGKRVGRVGDSPIVGAGTYAHDASVAVSATGQGEYFMRGVTAYSIAARVRFRGASVTAAAQAAVQEVQAMGGAGGVIVLGPEGTIAMPFTTRGMFRAAVAPNGTRMVRLFQSP